MRIVIAGLAGCLLMAAGPPPIIVPPNHLPLNIVAALERVVTPPQPRYSVQSVVSPDDYPAGAKGRGTVGMNLFIDKEGRAVECDITQSGGSSQLDVGTCNVVKRRARFTPALDRDGNPSIGRINVEVDWNKVFKSTRIVRMR